MSLLLRRWAKLYTAPTKAEQALEPEIAKLGRPYRAQHPVFAAGYIVDFALLDEKIAIEVDGSSHRGAKAQEKDRLRTLRLESLGWVVVRCTNEEALTDPASTVQRLLLDAKDRRAALEILKLAKVPNGRDHSHVGRNRRGMPDRVPQHHRPDHQD